MIKIFFTIAFALSVFFTSSLLLADDFDMRNTYLVIWTPTTTDNELLKETKAEQSTSLLELWQAGIIENVYFNNKKENKEREFGDKGKVVFFIKADTEDDAKKILETMPFVEKKIATYTLSPVGILWLKQF